jgi:hypothetical protein
MNVDDLAIVKFCEWISETTIDLPPIIRGALMVSIIAFIFVFGFITFKSYGYISLTVMGGGWFLIEFLHWIGGGHSF